MPFCYAFLTDTLLRTSASVRHGCHALSGNRLALHVLSIARTEPSFGILHDSACACDGLAHATDSGLKQAPWSLLCLPAVAMMSCMVLQLHAT